MPRRATGYVFFAKGSWYARVTLWRGKRQAFRMPAVGTREAAQARAEILAALAAQLAAAEQHDLAPRVIERGAEARDAAELGELVETTRRLCAGELVLKGTAGLTFRQLGEMWTRGELADRWPDHVKRKRTAHRDAALLRERVYPLVGDVRLADFTLEHAERVMQSLPEMEQATRRQHAQAIARILSLAAYPVRAIERTPIPRGFVPPQRSNKAKAYIYPSEDRALLGCADVPLGCRVLYGFLDREGMRVTEARLTAWSDLDLERGSVRLDTNKTDDPRAWALNPGTTRALRLWRAICADPPPDALVFGDLDFDWNHAARSFRTHLKLAGIDRPELFVRTKARLPIRVHDLRGTFVTISLANNRTEAWVAARTGHKSSAMIQGYNRLAQHAAELGLGDLAAMDEAIPELAATADEKTTEMATGPMLAVGVDGQDGDMMRESRAGGIGRHRRLKSPGHGGESSAGRENPAESQGVEDASRRDETPVALSGAPVVFSASPRADAIDDLTKHIAVLMRCGDIAAARVLQRALQDLTEGASDGGAEVISLADRRARES
jgi:integrase